MKVNIYALVNPIDDQVFYIGATIDPKARLYHHICNRTTGSYKEITIDKILKEGHKPQMLILDTVPVEYAEQSENHYINLYREKGIHLPQGPSNYKGETVERLKKQKDLTKYNNGSTPYNIHLKKEMLEQLKIIADEKDMKLPELIRSILKSYLRKQNQNVNGQ